MVPFEVPRVAKPRIVKTRLHASAAISCRQAGALCRLALALAMLCVLPELGATGSDALRIGSKRFTESYLLAEILTRTAATSTPARHVPGLGNTAIVFEALRRGSIDLYPEYLGTIELEILKRDAPTGSLEEVNRGLAAFGLAASIPFGFENRYALAVRADGDGAPALETISELAAEPQLRLGLSHEFLGRPDGWPGLRARYGLPQQPVGLDHGLAYEALAAGQVDVIDVYTTDAKLGRYRLRVLRDDLDHFPHYDAVVLHRADLPQRFPQAWAALQGLAGRIDEQQMIALNAQAELERRSFGDVAAEFVAGSATSPERSAGPASTAGSRAAANADSPAGTDSAAPRGSGLWRAIVAEDFWRLARQHLMLVCFSVTAAVLVGVPAGVAAVLRPRFGALLLPAVGALQTIPSLALLALLISALGVIGTLPALIALFAYALLPIVRNTWVGVGGIAPGIRDAADALGLRTGQRIALVDLPIALPVILAGVRTAAVINVGTATIAAFIGAGGFGERIVTGLALNDHRLLLAGALPAAALAFLVEAAFGLVDRWLKHRRG